MNVCLCIELLCMRSTVAACFYIKTLAGSETLLENVLVAL